MHIAILGTRGIPAAYGGFETFAEELGARLVERGHKVTVYGRRYFGQPRVPDGVHRGIATRTLPTFRHKYLETPFHAGLSCVDAFRLKPDLVLLCNAANSLTAWIPRLRGIPVAINVDGIERLRSKWNRLGKLWYQLGEIGALLFASRIVSDAEVIADYYRKRYRRESTVLAYGADVRPLPPGPVLAELGVEPDRYILYVSRLEPENNALGVIEAYGRIETDLPLVIVGDAPYADAYKAELRRAANERVKFAGFRFGDSYRELRSHCRLYVQATEVGGTHPALVEAMAYGNAIIANEVPEHREVLGDAGLYYPKNDFISLSGQLNALLSDDALTARLRRAAAERAGELYTWSRTVDGYEVLFRDLKPSGSIMESAALSK